MNILSLEHLQKSFTGRQLFDDVSFFLHEGDKVGIIGINGTGKSTLLKFIAGVVTPDEGSITMASNTVVQYLPQSPEFDPEDTVLQAVVKNVKENSDAWSVETNAKSMMTKLGITDFNQKTKELSGGQRKRLALVSVLVAPSDILVLDEPTNHLDSKMSSFLEEYLRKYRGSIVMVTHDRYFLDSVANRIVELDKGKLYSYEDNYSGYLIKREERDSLLASQEKKRQNILRKELAWIQRGARARSTKQKAHIQRYEDLANQEAPVFDAKVQMGSVSERLGKTTIEINNVSKSYGENVLIKDFTYIFGKDDRIGIIGPNGCGKTTLLKIIIGSIEPTAGSVTIGKTVKIGYYTQEISNDPSAGIAYMNPKRRVIDYIKDTAETVKTEDGTASASQMCERFLFDGEKQYSPIEKLSGGEKRRLNLLRVLMEAPNVLILDEPTNDLDITTLRILEDYLDDFKGIVITVSHDRYFLDRVVRRIFAYSEDGTLVQHEGGYTDYENRIKKLEESEESLNKPAKEAKSGNGGKYVKPQSTKIKFTYMEAKEFETIEDDIAALEEKLENLDSEMAKNATNSVKLSELLKEKEDTQTLLDTKMDRWMYLTELKEKIDEQERSKYDNLK